MRGLGRLGLVGLLSTGGMAISRSLGGVRGFSGGAVAREAGGPLRSRSGRAAARAAAAGPPLRGGLLAGQHVATRSHHRALMSGGAGTSRAPTVRGARGSSLAVAGSGTAAEPTAQGPSAGHWQEAAEASDPLGPPPRAGSYPFAAVEAKWQSYWERHETFRTPAFEDLDTSKPKFYALDMFPYPSGSGLHVGHPEGYTATDIIARYKRARGFNVLHPIGWDAFGLPAEQYAIQTGTHPKETTARNVDGFRRQLKSLGFSYDWSREISTAHPGYYRWTQWIFAQLARTGLAYRAEQAVNWCPALGTVLANEEVVDGLSERGGHPVERVPLTQWLLRITAYADGLLDGLDGLDWDPNVLEMQRHWIGRSVGADIDFPLATGRGGGEGGEGGSPAPAGTAGAAASPGTRPPSISVYTTRPETIFGATYLVVAPEHPLMDLLTTDERRAEVEAYRLKALAKSEVARAEEGGSGAKTGVFTGRHVINPATNRAIPVYTSDYVLGGYGSGAIMAVPAHDDRDAAFAAAFGLPVVAVLSDADPPATAGGGGPADAQRLINSTAPADHPAPPPRLEGLTAELAREAVLRWLAESGRGSRATRYRLRDWLFARQRYWGEPFPVVYPLETPEEALVLPDDQLPVLLPPMTDFSPTGTPDPPLSKAAGWIRTEVPAGSAPLGGVADGARSRPAPAPGSPAEREASTMPQWAGSSWYYLRFIDPRNEEILVDPEAERYWMPVDLYVGGAEHAVLHLLYARFWHRALFDLGVVSTPEPFQRLVSQGMILGEVEHSAWWEDDGVAAGQEGRTLGGPASPSLRGRFVPEQTDAARLVPVGEELVTVDKGSGRLVLKADPSIPVHSRAHKMSKSRGNVVNPDDVVLEFGADSLRLYEMFMGPLRDAKPWSTRGVGGVHRFLSRTWRVGSNSARSLELRRAGEEGGRAATADGSPATPPSGGASLRVPTPSTHPHIPVDLLRALHRTIERVTADTEALRFNTAIAAMMEFTNTLVKHEQAAREGEATTAPDAAASPSAAASASADAAASAAVAVPPEVLAPFVQLLAPYAPHVAEELWERLGHGGGISLAPWPEADAELARPPGRLVAVQVGGRTRGTIEVGEGATQEEAYALALADPSIARFVEGQAVARVVYVPGKILNVALAKKKKK